MYEGKSCVLLDDPHILLSAEIEKKNQKNISGIPAECLKAWIQIRPDICGATLFVEPGLVPNRFP